MKSMFKTLKVQLTRAFLPLLVTTALITCFNYINFTVKHNRAVTELENQQTSGVLASKQKIDLSHLVVDPDMSKLMKSISANNFDLFTVSINKSYNGGNPTIFYSNDKDQEVHKIVIPQSTYNSIENNYLLPKQINFQLADESFDSLNQEAITGIKKTSVLDQKFDWVNEILLSFTWGVGVAILWLIFYPLLFNTKGPGHNEPAPNFANNNGGKAIMPETIQGGIDELIGLEDIKMEVLQVEHMIKNRHLYKAHDIEKPFNILMSGPAGTGKTKMASYLAKSLNIPMFSQPAGALETGLMGGGSQTLNDLYKEASHHPMALVFLDEGQVLLEKRGKDMTRKNADDTANTLLSILDGTNTKGQSQIITVIASNFNDATYEMDEAMLRRFPIKIDFRLPNLEERKEILEFYLSKKDSKLIDNDNLNLNYIADITAGMSPALINSVTDKASLISIQDNAPIDTKVLFRAFERCSVGITDRAKTKGRDEERKRIAIHELGHFFTQINPHIKKNLSWDAIKDSSRFLKISTEAVAKVNALGYVLNSQEDTNLKTLSQLEQEIVELYGGAAAEEVFYGKKEISVGSSNDFEKATRILNVMVSKLSMYGESKLNYSLIEGADFKPNVLIMEEISKRLYQDAILAVKDNMVIIEKLTDILMRDYVMNKDEIFGWLADHYFQLQKDTVAN